MHMDITPYVESLRSSLASAADSAGEETRQAAERLGFALDSSARLAIMEAVSQAAAEITAEMPNGGVDVRLNGRDLDFLVHVACRDTEHLRVLTIRSFTSRPEVSRIETSLVFSFSRSSLAVE